MIYLFFRFFTPIRTVYYRFPYIFPLFSHRKGSLTHRADLRFTIDSTIKDFHKLLYHYSLLDLHFRLWSIVPISRKSLDLLDDLYTLYDMSEDRMLAIEEARIFCGHYEEL